MKISHLIFFGFIFILLLFSITTYINYNQSNAVKENTDFVTRSSTIVRQSNRFQRNLLIIGSGLRGYLLTGEPSFMQTFDSAAAENTTILAELPPLLDEPIQQRKSFDSIGTRYSHWMNTFAGPISTLYKKNIANRNHTLGADSTYKNIFLSEENTRTNLDLQRRLRTFINNEYNNRESKKIELAASIQETKRISLFLNIFSIIAGVAIAFLLAIGISRRIMKMVRMSERIASGDYKVHVKETGKDELGLLAKSLNNMSDVLNESFSELKRKNAELDQFAHIASHDMKAPLRGIDNVITWIEEDHDNELSPKVQEYMGIIKGRVRRAENLIAGILSYARVGKDVRDTELVSVKALVEEVIENIDGNNKIEFEVSETLPVFQTERLTLFQVFSNLISNAIKYHDKANGKVSVYHEDHGDHFTFFVKDDGPGIASHYHEKIFQIFQTLQDRDSFESTGVGLAIVKKILDENNEQIHIQSEPGKGSVFSFTWSK
jgi:signal transduction histidine kinase